MSPPLCQLSYPAVGKVAVRYAKWSACVNARKAVLTMKMSADLRPRRVAVAASLSMALLVGWAGAEPAEFGKLPDGRPVKIFTLRNAAGCEARILDYGGIVVSLKTPDRAGKFSNIVLGFDNLADYVQRSPYYGAIIGRYANRIAGGTFALDGKTYTLAKNFNGHHLHGGTRGFDKVVWSAMPSGDATLTLRYTSKDGEEGYPGTMAVEAVYTLTEKNVLRLEMTATTDRPTVCSLTQHSYFNLTGDSSTNVLDHVLTIWADRYTLAGDDRIPTGVLAPVQGTAFDFTRPRRIGARMAEVGGYDHNWVLQNKAGKLALAARVEDPHSGRTLEVLTTAPGLQCYVSDHALCLEPQMFPDSPNRPEFPSAVLRPGETYRHTIEYRFGVGR